jgi:phage shock protein PspC (stress-responsive transcriptional regulator)
VALVSGHLELVHDLQSGLALFEVGRRLFHLKLEAEFEHMIHGLFDLVDLVTFVFLNVKYLRQKVFGVFGGCLVYYGGDVAVVETFFFCFFEAPVEGV